MAAKKQSYRVEVETDETTPTSLLPEEQAELDLYKKRLRFDNEIYLRDHPEIRTVLKEFVKGVMKERPDDVKQYAARFFSNPTLPSIVAEEMGRMEERRRELLVVRKLPTSPRGSSQPPQSEANTEES